MKSLVPCSGVSSEWVRYEQSGKLGTVASYMDLFQFESIYG